MDSKLHETGGSVPVHDKISYPAAATGAREFPHIACINDDYDDDTLTPSSVKGKEKAAVAVEDDEEEELRKLQAEMAM